MTKKEKRIAAIREEKANAIEARNEYVTLGMAYAVLACNGFIAECNDKLSKLGAE